MHLLIPVKRFELAKTRLAVVLRPQSRQALMRAMLRDLLEQVARVRGIDQVVLLSDEPELQHWSRRFGVRQLREATEANALNAILSAALVALQKEGVRRVMILHADLPLACAPDLQRLVDDDAATARDALVLVPDRTRLGTNGMILSLPRAIGLRYGAKSFELHRQQAAMSSVPVTIAHAPSLAHDVDVEDDIVGLASAQRSNGMGPAHHTLRALTESAVAERATSAEKSLALG